MHMQQDDVRIRQAYHDRRPYLVDLAFRMLGDIGAAEDTVQDAFTRLLRADSGQIEDERGGRRPAPVGSLPDTPAGYRRP